MPVPPFAYYGGKTTLAPTIAALLPTHTHYVEPFAGGLSVLLAKDPTTWETVNDLDGNLMTFWRVLRDRPDELARVCELTPHSRAEIASACEPIEHLDDLERARRVWIRIAQSRRKTTDAIGGGWWFGVAGNGKPIHDRLNTFVSRMEDASKRLARVTLESRDAVDVIATYGREPTVCIYADPPYLGSTRKSGYGIEMLSDSMHARLADALNSCKASVVLSGYDSPLYADIYDGWFRTELKAPQTLALKPAEYAEVLWSNVPLGTQGVLDFGETA